MKIFLKVVGTLATLVVLIAGGWVFATLHFTYASGERAGYIQKISRKGWICKTWEGELAMANLPGAMPQVFEFSVRDDEIAHLIELNAGKRVALSYEQHPGIPTRCFGDTEYFIVKLTPVEEPANPPPGVLPPRDAAAPAATPAPAATEGPKPN